MEKYFVRFEPLGRILDGIRKHGKPKFVDQIIAKICGICTCCGIIYQKIIGLYHMIVNVLCQIQLPQQSTVILCQTCAGNSAHIRNICSFEYAMVKPNLFIMHPGEPPSGSKRIQIIQSLAMFGVVAQPGS